MTGIVTWLVELWYAIRLSWQMAEVRLRELEAEDDVTGSALTPEEPRP